MTTTPFSGQLAHLNTRVSCNTNDLVDFEQTFNKWHRGILLTKITYYQTEFGNMCFGPDTKPFVIIEPMGFFDNINIFASRLINEFNKMSGEKGHERNITARCIFRGGDSLEINVDNGSTKVEFMATFLDRNQESSDRNNNSLKYDISC